MAPALPAGPQGGLQRGLQPLRAALGHVALAAAVHASASSHQSFPGPRQGRWTPRCAAACPACSPPLPSLALLLPMREWTRCPGATVGMGASCFHCGPGFLALLCRPTLGRCLLSRPQG